MIKEDKKCYHTNTENQRRQKKPGRKKQKQRTRAIKKKSNKHGKYEYNFINNRFYRTLIEKNEQNKKRVL